MVKNATPHAPAEANAPDWSALVDYSASLDCIHCGLCLRSCPTYELTGRESSSPRGRIHLMRAVGEGRLEPDAAFGEEMDFCLVCRNCETVCPAGVEFGAMMEHTRSGLEDVRSRSLKGRFLRWIGLRVLVPNRLALELAASSARLAHQVGIMGLASRILGNAVPSPESQPPIPSRRERRLLPQRTESLGPQLEEVYLLDGCLMPVFLGRVNRASAQVLSALGVLVKAPREAGCCGSLHAHNGDRSEAQRLAKAMIAAYGGAGDPAPIVVGSAGCGSHMKEYPGLFEAGTADFAAAEAFSARVLDWTEFLAARLDRLRLAMGGTEPAKPGLAARLGAVNDVATWDAPCHLCHGQGVRDEPLAVLDAALEAGAMERRELHESERCCGSAGTYSMTHADASNELLESKLDDLETTGASLLVTANPGCQLQWEIGIRRRGLTVRVAHIAEVVAANLD
ncbi:MAG: heterodisulfide reductase-related iron-sulfur binding cluster [Planctomycetota bacterium]|nr:heterodisulfide reductase-related iron-sulfur binding cluster [Planctomycetota bacterium]